MFSFLKNEKMNCKYCKPDSPTIGKTFFVLKDNSVLCYRHFYQSGKKEYQYQGDIFSVTEMMKGRSKFSPKKTTRCFDKFGNEIRDGDIVSVQMAGNQIVYTKNGHLMFKPYGDEEMVKDYFSNDLELKKYDR